MNDPRVSVCMLSYNHEEYIAQAIKSVLSQTCSFPIEIVLGDDRSTDQTVSIVHRLANHSHIPIRLLVRKVNLGMMNNFIQTFNDCRGEFVAFLEGDDYWTDPLKLEKQISFLSQHAAYSGAFHETQLVFHPDKQVGRIYGREAPADVTVRDTFSKTAIFHTSSVVIRRNHLCLPSWLTEVISGDIAIFSLAAANGPLRKIPEIMSVYRRHEAGITNSEFVKRHYHQCRIDLLKRLDEFHTWQYHNEAQQVIAFHRDELLKENRISTKFYKIAQSWLRYLNIR
jgi:glycosyltransferase involved in cell wall biosynthesis